ncbi:uncharacterized protein LOC121387640 [Gigantopelta aegis]|uniref:uncharacterized protein LOC121387640 n=1 Tax=Gigantopelta aegis TaxID=1735272 RepID=UPI001B88BBA3|nr:uncharacterized protein LOC121387640 [Gigantopelta aegis]
MVGSRLRRYWRNWQTLCQDPFVTSILKTGYRLQLSAIPPLTTSPREPRHSVAQVKVLQESVNKLVEKGAVRSISEVHLTPGFYSDIFLVPKKDSPELRMIHNLAVFNDHYLSPPPTFKMLTLRDIIAVIRPGDWLASLDLKDAYLHVPMHADFHHYLRFVLQGRHYEWTVLPFGISIAPWLFTRITTPMSRFLHRRGISFYPYLDDCLMRCHSKTGLTAHVAFIMDFLKQLGWIINIEKSRLAPTQSLQFIGAWLRPDLGLVRVPLDRWEKIQTMIVIALTAPMTFRGWQSLLGLLTSAQDLTLRGRLQLRRLQMFLNPFVRFNNPDLIISLPDDLRSSLQWWQLRSNVLEGVSMRAFIATHHLFVDASLEGWGAHLSNQTTSGLWSPGELGLHINLLELLAVYYAILHWRQMLTEASLMVATDSTTAAAYINRQGGTHSSSLLQSSTPVSATKMGPEFGVTSIIDRTL